MKILILGHTGMLGNALVRYFTDQSHEALTITSRYPEEKFLTDIQSLAPDFIVNCIGAIPQKNPSSAEYKLLNEDLPRSLDGLGIPVIHPSTDCEFDGRLPTGESYKKDQVRNAADDYGASKAVISNWLEEDSKHTKIIRTSILGHELNTHYSLLDWFLFQTGEINGYTDQYWNGVTTLEWAKQCQALINNWSTTPKLTQLANPDCLSKYEVLKTAGVVYQKPTMIRPTPSGKPTNKCLVSDFTLDDLESQLRQLKEFYGK